MYKGGRFGVGAMDIEPTGIVGYFKGKILAIGGQFINVCNFSDANFG